MDKEIKEKITQGRQILDMLEKLANGDIDLSECKNKKCENCGNEHPTIEDAIKTESHAPTRATPEQAKNIKNRLDTVLYHEVGVAFISAKTDGGGNSTQIIRNMEVPELMTAAVVFLKNAFESSVERIGEKYRDSLKTAAHQAINQALKD